MSDAPTEKFDPTESVRTLSASLFKETNMSLREHQDTDKHYIGDSLPVPSLSHVMSSGVASAVGGSPFPARADHSHEDRAVYGFFYSTAWVPTSPGQVFMNVFAVQYGRNMLASPQVFSFPFQGVYIINADFYINRQGGGAFVNEMNIVFFYYNGTVQKLVYRQSNFDLPVHANLSVVDTFHAHDNPSLDNLQIAVQQNDVVPWDVGCSVRIIRLGSTVHYRSVMAGPSRLLNPVDSRSTRGIMSRGRARYGVSNSPKPGNITNIQKAAQARVKKMQKLNDARRQR